MLARQAGLEIWRRFGVPVYFYEAAAARPDRVNLEDVRRGQFEGLRETAHQRCGTAAGRRRAGDPPTAGASAVGARRFLIAYNIYLESPETAAQAGAELPRQRRRTLRRRGRLRGRFARRRAGCMG